ncbi:SAM-dependent methyltransferase [Pseudonocardia sp. HH130630-07]|uniref:SAM-dependent methyltransferase n=1 Tax=Pseudonocardia sp. HH130630-07 TaxID=1690815 RepID=UPI000814F110|nr:SAM-dependent methyltransferase [Pseudonocardia sp. HH130630-07]ANY06178.1 hypothetical protein AFB00_07560 [Pseudonocardia sp. HH130630-07]
MSDRPEPGLEPDLDRANAARMYDYLLGGSLNFAVDRDAAENALAHYPHLRDVAQSNRRFLGRAVRWCLDDGVHQFLDLGSGIPTAGNVHEIAHRSDPAARVAYVDNEPVAVQASRTVVADLDTVSITRADLRTPAAVLGAPTVTGLLDLDRPVAVIAVAVLHFVPGDLAELLDAYRAVLAPGSVVVLSHSSDDVDDPALARQVREAAATYANTSTSATLRTRAEIVAALGGADRLVGPGLVDVVDWPRAEPGTDRTGIYGAVARVATAAR